MLAEPKTLRSDEVILCKLVGWCEVFGGIKKMEILLFITTVVVQLFFRPAGERPSRLMTICSKDELLQM